MDKLLYHAVALGDLGQVMEILGIERRGQESKFDGETRLMNLGYAHGPNKTTCLHACCAKRSVRMLRMILEELDFLDDKARKKILNKREDSKIGGYTPLHVATLSGSMDVVEVLLEGGADPDIPDTNSGFTSLHLAVRAGFLDIARILIQLGGADVNARDQFGNNPAFWFKEYQHSYSELEKLLGQPKSATIEERFFAINKDRLARGLPIGTLPAAPTKDIPSYLSKMKKVKGKAKKKGGKAKKKK